MERAGAAQPCCPAPTGKTFSQEAFMTNGPILLAKGPHELFLLPQMANRHGLIAGATGTGKTVTLQVLAEQFSQRGVPVFMADVKGDLAGISQPGRSNPKIEERIQRLGLTDFTFHSSPVTFWDVFGELGHPVRATVSDMGPLLLSRLLQLNDTQAGVLNIVFRIADDHGLLLLDPKDLRAMLQHVGQNASQFTLEYGNISAASIGAIQRNLLGLEQQGAEKFFGEPALNLDDFLQTDADGRGVINILAADKLMSAPKVYATLLLWLLSELFERFPEVGDLPKPKLVFFFDEAHLLFSDIPPVLLERIEQVIRLVRSKGVGVYFVTQNPRDIPDNVLGQLGNRVQHALRAYTPRDQRAVQAAADTFRVNPNFKTDSVLMELGVGEALVSLLDQKGHPGIVERASILPPRGQIGPITPDQRAAIIQQSLVYGTYEQPIDRDSAYEKLKKAHPPQVVPSPQSPPEQGWASTVFGGGRGSQSPARGRGRQPDSLTTAMAKSAARTIGSSVGREIVRGVLGSIFGGRRR
jgi:DNA helicase HerA-like ATPase